jgi:hypothetical protein
MQSTNQDRQPIPPAPTQIGDPNGHHEITEPDFSATRPCRGCSPVIEITATGWLDTPAEEHHESTERLKSPPLTTQAPPIATISAGPATVIVQQGTDGDDFVIGSSYTIVPGKPITVDNTLFEIRTSGSYTEMVVGTAVIPLQPSHQQTTNALPPPPPILNIGTTTIIPNIRSECGLGGQTLVLGGSPLTTSGTTLSRSPSATLLVVNGETSSVTPVVGGVYTAVVPSALTFQDQIYTANRVGYIIMGPGTTLIPGGNPVTIDGTTLSLEPSGSAVVVQSTTITLQPVATDVTLKKGPNVLETGSGSECGKDIRVHSTGNVYLYPSLKDTTAGTIRCHSALSNGWLGSVVLLVWWGMGYSGLNL